MIKIYRTLSILFLLSTVLFFCACRDSRKTKKIKLRAAAVIENNKTGISDSGSAPLRISVAAMLSPKSSFVTYGELAQYLGKRLDLPVKVLFTKKYRETNDSLRSSESDIAFICTGAYLAAKEEFPLDIIAVPVISGQSVYNSVIVVPKNSPVLNFGGLKGKTFAFTDEFSLTGHLYVQARLAGLQQTSAFFSGTVFTGSHDNSIKAVAEGFADAASVDNLVYQALLRRGDFHARQLKVLEKSPPFGIPPVVARHSLGVEVKARARAILLDMHKDNEGARILKTVSIERFVVPAPGLYSYAEQVYRGLNKK